MKVLKLQNESRIGLNIGMNKPKLRLKLLYQKKTDKKLRECILVDNETHFEKRKKQNFQKQPRSFYARKQKLFCRALCVKNSN